MIRKKVVICNPKFFDVSYIINPWMKENVHKVNKGLAMNQWLNLKNLLISKGLEVKEISPDKNFPDMVFTANHGMRIGNFFVVSNFRFKERRGELEFAIPQILENEELVKINCPYFWEGEAELFRFDKNIYIGGYGKRGTIKALRWFQKTFNIKVLPLKIKDDKFYHLDTCLTIRNKKIYLYPPAFYENTLNNLINILGYKNIVFLSKRIAEKFGANCIQLEDCLIVGTTDKQTLSEMEKLFKTKVISVDMSEFIKSGGSVFCSKLFL